MKSKKIWWILSLTMTLLALVWAGNPYGCYTPSNTQCQPGGKPVAAPGGSSSLQTVHGLSDRGQPEPAQVVRNRLEELYGK